MKVLKNAKSTKVCSKTNQRLPISEFRVVNKGKDNERTLPYCRDWGRQYTKNRRLKNKLTFDFEGHLFTIEFKSKKNIVDTNPKIIYLRDGEVIGKKSFFESQRLSNIVKEGEKIQLKFRVYKGKVILTVLDQNGEEIKVGFGKVPNTIISKSVDVVIKDSKVTTK